MALGSGISVSMGGGVGGSSGDTVHVNNQPMIVLLVPFRKKRWVALGGGVGLGEKGYTSRFFFIPVSLVLSFTDILMLPSSILSAANSPCHLNR